MASIREVEFFENLSVQDQRGYFRRTLNIADLPSAVRGNFLQSSVSFNKKRGTVRGMHYQASPSKEWKHVSCLKGRIFDCLVDVRIDSPTYGAIHYFEISEENGMSVLIPPGVAHGFQTQVDETYVHYQMTDIHKPELARRLLWNDKALDIPWPIITSTISSLDSIGEPWPVVY